MNRLLAAMVLGLFLVGVVRADIPPPKGLKRVTVDHKIVTDKEYPDYVFFTLIGGGKTGGTLTAVKLDPKTPVVITGAGRGGIGRLGSFIGVPKDAATKYDTEKDFHAAIKEGKVEGLVKAKKNFDAFTVVKDTDTRKLIVMEYSLDKIDAKDGIVLTAKTEETPKKDPPPEESDIPTDDGIATAYTPRGGVWVAGLAGSAALVFGGLWVVRRNRHGREVGT